MKADHLNGVVGQLIRAAFHPEKIGLSRANDFAALLPPDSPPLALLDIPTGFFTWDLLDAYPNSTVSLAVRTVCNLPGICSVLLDCQRSALHD